MSTQPEIDVLQIAINTFDWFMEKTPDLVRGPLALQACIDSQD